MKYLATLATVLGAAVVAGLVIPGCGQSGKPAAPAASDAAPAASAPAIPQAPAVAEPEADRSVTKLGQESAETPVKGDWLVIAAPAEMAHLNPVTSTDAYATRITEHIFENLLEINPVTMEMEPALAERWEESPDHLVYTFYLRKDVTFSDGKPLTAQDVKFTFEKIMDPAVDAAPIRGYFENVKSCELLDDYTVRFTCAKPFWQHLVFLGDFDIMPKHIYETGDFNNHPNARSPIGSGPYILEKWDAGQQLILARNPNYWNKDGATAGNIDKWIYKFISNDDTALQALLGGDVDMASLKPKHWVGRAAEPDFEARFQKKTWYSPFYNYIGWNSRKPQFADKRVRRAMTLMLDRETIRQTIFEGLAQSVPAGFLPGTPSYNPAIQPLPFDPTAAVALLDEAGWKDTDGDGIRDKDGVPFRFEILLVNESPESEQTATFLKEELSRAGVELNIRALEWAVMTERVQKFDFDAYMLGWSMDPFPDAYQLWHSSQAEAGSNYVGFNNAEADELILKARETFDSVERNKIFFRFQEIMHEEQPYTFMFSPAALLALDKRVHNTVVYPLLRNRPRFEWFVPAELQKYGK
jgi:peptide/nickel transport system substrate-binding protein